MEKQELTGRPHESADFTGLDDYQKRAHGFAAYGDNQAYAYLGLAEEAGEVAGKAAKFIRHNDGLPPWCDLTYALKDEREAFRQDMMKELGDVLWFVAELATLNGIALSELAEGNLAKLEDRRTRGVIDGSGDNR